MARYSPPTHERGINSTERILSFYRLTYANSIIKVAGVWTSVSTPSPEVTSALTEGVDWFRGGREYQLSAELIAELTAAGFPSAY